jgi:hypothetical protein
MYLVNTGKAVAGGGGGNLFSLIAHAFAAAASSPATSAIDTTGANLLVVAVEQFGNLLGSLADSKSNTWTGLTAQTQAADAYVSLFYCASPTVGSGHTFTYFGANIFGGIAVQAWSGANAAPFDVENGAGATSTTISTGSVTPSVSNSLIITGLCGSTGSHTYAIDSGFTITDSADYSAGTDLGIAMAYLKQGSATAVNPTWSWVTSSNAAAAIAVFKP